MAGKILYSMMMMMILMILGGGRRVEGMSWWNAPLLPSRFDIRFNYKEPSPGVTKCARDCKQRLPAFCNGEIWDHIFMFSPVSTECCESFVKNGEDCNRCVIQCHSAIGRLKKYGPRIESFSNRLFQECKRRLGHVR